MSPRLVVRLGLLFLGLLVFFWLLLSFVALPWVVSGDSMEPALSHGDRVLVDLWTFRQRLPRPGEVVLFRGPLPEQPVLVKRAVPPGHGGVPAPIPVHWPPGPHRRGVWVLGDRAGASTDSRQFGSVPPAEIRGRVLFRYWPLSSAGFL